MNTNTLLFFTSWFFYLSVFSQTHSISGRIVNEKGKPIEFAPVTVHPSSESTAVKGTITRPSGDFKIDGLKINTYQITVQMLGFTDWTWELSLSADLTLEDIQLQISSEALETIEVRAERPSLESHLGKKVLHIGADLATGGSNALEALEVIPSVTTTQKGRVQIRGDTNVIVYINGKETKRDPRTLQYISAICQK